MSEEIHAQLGEIKGLLKGIDGKVNGLDHRLEKQDERLRLVERRSITNSVITSGVISIGLAFIKDKIGM
ncbi:hypothetical protein [Cohaesibacter sp. ES.047]|uniref:hypothetical protein n=1 Tax=Cohaesibacter sp. ES.047 TaxID=1798205 RepID=UPI000BB73BA2|nr:hypothetical protein [Cohaesibacter sp. ES.047]